MTSEAPELLPCPFCGSQKAHVFPCNNDEVREHRIYPIVRCCGCYLDLPGKNDDFSQDGKTAVAAWNTRANQQALDAAREEGRRQGLREAAKVAEPKKKSARLKGGGWFKDTYRDKGSVTAIQVRQQVAENIRALIDKPGDAQKEGE